MKKLNIEQLKKEVDEYKDGLSPKSLEAFETQTADMLFIQSIYSLFIPGRRIGHAILIYHKFINGGKEECKKKET